jgi:hypothetical protein
MPRSTSCVTDGNKQTLVVGMGLKITLLLLITSPFKVVWICANPLTPQQEDGVNRGGQAPTGCLVHCTGSRLR